MATMARTIDPTVYSKGTEYNRIIGLIRTTKGDTDTDVMRPGVISFTDTEEVYIWPDLSQVMQDEPVAPPIVGLSLPALLDILCWYDPDRVGRALADVREQMSWVTDDDE